MALASQDTDIIAFDRCATVASIPNPSTTEDASRADIVSGDGLAHLKIDSD